MKAASAVSIFRSVGDGDPILVSLRYQTESGEVAVPDSASVDLRVKVGAAVLVFAGVGKGSGSGIWAFAPAGLPVTPGRLPYSIAVTVDGYSYTHGRGAIDLAEHV